MDFDSFIESPKITGEIKLPENMLGITDTIYGSVFVQGSEPPYFNIDEYTFDFSAENEKAGFELYNDCGADNVIIYYLLYSDIDGLYLGGNYFNDTTCVPNVKDAAVLDGASRNIEINMINGQRIGVSFESSEDAQGADFYLLTGENESVALYGFSMYSSEEDRYFNIPCDLKTYRIMADTAPYDESKHIMYYDGEKFTENMTAAKVYNTEKDKNIGVYWNGYTEISDSSAYVDTETSEILVYVYARNVPDAAKLFAVGYGDAGISCAAAVNNGEAVLSAENVKKVKIFCWKSLESMIPLCDAQQAELEYY